MKKGGKEEIKKEKKRERKKGRKKRTFSILIWGKAYWTSGSVSHFREYELNSGSCSNILSKISIHTNQIEPYYHLCSLAEKVPEHLTRFWHMEKKQHSWLTGGIIIKYSDNVKCDSISSPPSQEPWTWTTELQASATEWVRYNVARCTKSWACCSTLTLWPPVSSGFLSWVQEF